MISIWRKRGRWSAPCVLLKVIRAGFFGGILDTVALIFNEIGLNPVPFTPDPKLFDNFVFDNTCYWLGNVMIIFDNINFQAKFRAIPKKVSRQFHFFYQLFTHVK